MIAGDLSPTMLDETATRFRRSGLKLPDLIRCVPRSSWLPSELVGATIAPRRTCPAYMQLSWFVEDTHERLNRKIGSNYVQIQEGYRSSLHTAYRLAQVLAVASERSHTVSYLFTMADMSGHNE